MPFEAELLEYMRARRAEERYLRIFHLMNWVKKNQHEWLTSYVDSKTSQEKAYDSLRRLLCRFCERYRFTQRVPCVNKVLQSVLEEVWLGYAAHFWSKYSDYPPSRILNADETGVYFDMPPGKTYAEIGQSSKVDKSSKQSERISVVLTIRADGVKLPLLFIVKGQPGGLIENHELPNYPAPHVMLAENVDDSSVLLVDNLDCHVSDVSHDLAAEANFSVVESLPPNSTSRCQPLDVGTMGPLKAMLKTEWLLEELEQDGDSMTAQGCATINRTIRVWEKISTANVISAFEKSIPSVLEI
ncbi:hypothetical protein LEN26_009571 [Aphanomyces euteiches]|nr:hypothetical protein LEN26_009571 [Aphanomyces euteiches]